MSQDSETEFEVLCNEEWVAGTSGPHETAFAEAMHYAQQYAADGPVQVRQILRSTVWVWPLPVKGQA